MTKGIKHEYVNEKKKCQGSIDPGQNSKYIIGFMNLS